MEKFPSNNIERPKTNTVEGNSKTSEQFQEQAEKYINYIKAEFEERDKYNEYAKKAYKDEYEAGGFDEYTHSGYTEKTLEVAPAFLERVVELAKNFNVHCVIEVPDWNAEEPHESMGSTSRMTRDALVKVTFRIDDEGKKEEKQTVLSIAPDEDDVLTYAEPLPYPSNKKDFSRFGLEEGWDDNDAKNWIAQDSFHEAMRQMPLP